MIAILFQVHVLEEDHMVTIVLVDAKLAVCVRALVARENNLLMLMALLLAV